MGKINKWKKLNEFYKHKSVSENIKDIEVDNNINKDENYVKSIYKKYNIVQYNNKEAFAHNLYDYIRTTILKDNPNLTMIRHKGGKNINIKRENELNQMIDVEIDKRWREYQHRDALIRTGQYDNYRIEQYRKNYLESLRSADVSIGIIDTLENLSIEDFRKLVEKRNSNNDTLNKYSLPVIGFTYKISGLSDDGGRVLDTEIKRALKELDLYEEEFTEDEKTAINNYYEELERIDEEEYKKLNKKYNKTKPYTLNRESAGLYRRLSRNYRKYYASSLHTIDKSYSQKLLFEQVYLQSIKKDKPTIYVSKQGYEYIPFVGSTRPGSKNRDIVLAYIEYERKKYK